jgi:hypothetical protein
MSQCCVLILDSKRLETKVFGQQNFMENPGVAAKNGPYFYQLQMCKIDKRTIKPAQCCHRINNESEGQAEPQVLIVQERS